MKFNKREFKMHLLKSLVNQVTPRILRLAKGVEAKTPQSRLILRVFDRLEAVLQKDAETGCFNDKNFKNLVNSTKEALIFLCEYDQYYKRWLGLLAMFLAEELSHAYQNFNYQEALDMTCRPLMLSEAEFLKHKRSLFELHLSGYLYGLSLTHENIKTEIKKAKEEQKFVDFPSKDEDAYVRLYFPSVTSSAFMLHLRDRHEKKG